ncbi:MAG: HU family DNA-binding protein [Nitrospirae bacterium]|nr:HU family DNA-binding protein [Nitrospirota bacterium]MBF0554576.1 HU family DNA-binding protein [Nitrospirota bacterium]
MNKAEVIEALSRKVTILKKKDIEAVLEAYYETVTETLSTGEAIAIKGLGTFSVRERKATTARNPQTGNPIKVPARKVVKFTPALNLKKAVDK